MRSALRLTLLCSAALLTPSALLADQIPPLNSGGSVEVQLAPPGYEAQGSSNVSVTFPGSAKGAPESGTAVATGGPVISTTASIASSGPYSSNPLYPPKGLSAVSTYGQYFTITGTPGQLVAVDLQSSGAASTSGQGPGIGREFIGLAQTFTAIDSIENGPNIVSAQACSEIAQPSDPFNDCEMGYGLPLYPPSFNLNQIVYLTTGDDYQLYISSEASGGASVPGAGEQVNASATASVTLLGNQGPYAISYFPEITSTPEPSTLALLGTGTLAIAGLLQRRLRAQR